MENLVESYIVDAGFVKNQTYFKEMKIKEIEKKFCYATIDLWQKSIKKESQLI